MFLTKAVIQVLRFIKKWAKGPGKSPLAGSTVHCDFAFLKVFCLFFRSVDVFFMTIFDEF